MTEREGLPKTLKPKNYNVSLKPNFDHFRFSGKVLIHLTVLVPTKEIVANAHELEVLTASVKMELTTWTPKIVMLPEEQIVKLILDSELPAGKDIVVEMEFTGHHNDQMAGFYRSGYTDLQGNKKFMMVTQFQATDCRRCFPCWDEPDLKATFDISLEIPMETTGLSNMNVVQEKHLGTTKWIQFATTPIMSTYLIAICVGEFEYVEAIAKPKDAHPIVCRVYSSPGQKHLGHFGLDICTKALEFYSALFGIPYPLTKMDMIGIPDFGLGAMENWGLVTYRESALLFDPEKSSGAAKERIASIIFHELAHQWFGNLVTMNWWNELWLNEGFATFISWVACDHYFPEWNVFTSFVIGDFAQGQQLDALRSSHPIEVEVRSPAEVSQVFDAISYSKGASVIRMLYNYLGSDVFIRGISEYLKTYSYSNATTVNLWQSLGKVSGKDIERMMLEWTREIGFPYLKVLGEHYDEKNEELTVELFQQRFLSTGDVTTDEDTSIWSIPIRVQTQDGVQVHMFDQKQGKISFRYKKSTEAFWKLNECTAGFYRVLYQKSQLEMLSKRLGQNLDSFTPSDRIGILSDAFAFARAGYCSTTDVLDILQSYKKEENAFVLREISHCFESLKSVWYQDQDAILRLNKLQCSIFSEKVKQLGLEYNPQEDYMVVSKRNVSILNAISGRDPLVISQLLEKFGAFVNGSQSFHSNIRAVVFRTALVDGKNIQKNFDFLLDLAKNATNIDEKTTALSLLGVANDLELTRRVLYEIVFDPVIVKPQDIVRCVATIAAYNPNTEAVLGMLWHWYTENFDLLHSKLSSTITLFSRVLEYSVGANVGEDFLAKLQDWSQGKGLDQNQRDQRLKKLKNAQRSLEQSLETIGGNTRWLHRDQQAVRQWLLANLK
jgi:aminopeptidase 2